MFKLTLFFALMGLSYCATVPDVVPIVAQNADSQPDGTFKWSFEAGDGTAQEQQGVPKPVDKEVVEVIQGHVTYTDPDGVKHETQYVADESGYHPQSADVPVAPAVPPAIVKALDYIAAHPPTEHSVVV
ncbi:endocuticle structural glycoprotein ABD-4-like [Anthonomus grandis grandis]|uniref:endocuticle structural glycoprotein ABD-4-like n=1 Tax=Anthonomus grandis grandis TaxID=2921223 RepID=UPI002165C981|nr:endocuticle structural glycoprotein ABD-4-like [Anthonomus grandis grandis]